MCLRTPVGGCHSSLHLQLPDHSRTRPPLPSLHGTPARHSSPFNHTPASFHMMRETKNPSSPATGLIILYYLSITLSPFHVVSHFPCTMSAIWCGAHSNCVCVCYLFEKFGQTRVDTIHLYWHFLRTRLDFWAEYHRKDLGVLCTIFTVECVHVLHSPPLTLINHHTRRAQTWAMGPPP